MTLDLVALAAQDTPLPMPWSRIKRTLDSFEVRFVRGGLRLQQARVEALQPVVEEALRRGTPLAIVTLEGSFQDLVEAYVGQVLVEGIVQGDADVRAEERRARAAGVNLAVDGEPVVPKEAIAFIESRRDLNRFFDAEQAEKVRTIVGNALREGATVKQTMDALQTALPGAGRARLENIARTEATAAYNQGRIYRFLQSKGFIQAVRFDAILDSRVTDICEHRNGLLFALDDPRLRQNVPPLHYQCRSVLSPISGYKLEKMGGKARLDADRAKMDDAPGPQVTKKGRFGNEPWPDVQGGAAPTPRAKPVGPKGPVDPKGPGRGEARPGPEDSPQIQVRTLPLEPGKIHLPPENPVILPGPGELHREVSKTGLLVSRAPSIEKDDTVVSEILEAINGLPGNVHSVLRNNAVEIAFEDAGFRSRKPAYVTSEEHWRDVCDLAIKHGAACLTGYPERGRITIVVFPNRLRTIAPSRGMAVSGLHEVGHAMFETMQLEGDPDIQVAFNREHRRLPDDFRKSLGEFVAEGFSWYYNDLLNRSLLDKAPLLHVIIGGKMVQLRGDTTEVLYRGDDGNAIYGSEDDAIGFILDVGLGVHGGTLYSDGTIVSVSGGSKTPPGGPIKVSWSEIKTWTPEEAEPYKAFLRSKGVTLPHVMS